MKWMLFAYFCTFYFCCALQAALDQSIDGTDSRRQIAGENYVKMDEILAGSVAGFVQRIVEHPFDSIKTRLQSQSLEKRGKIYSSSQACFNSIIREGGWRNLYNGLPAPLLGSIAENAVLFSSYAWINRYVASMQPFHDPNLFSVLTSSSVAGLVSGLLVSFILTPVELIKCRMQVSGENGRIKYGSSYDCFRSIIKNEGGFLGLFRGALGPTCLRESVGCMAWFSIYEGLIFTWYPKTTAADVNRDRLEILGPWKLLLAGAVSGLGFNLIMFPADVVKSRLQVAPPSQSAWSVTRQLFAAEGYRGLYRGCAITCLRSIPTSACMFLSYESSMRMLNWGKK